MRIQDLGLIGYHQAWDIQRAAHDRVTAGAEECIFLVEHPPVITLGRRPGIAKNLLVSEDLLRQRGVELVETDRGGDITYHGPGQLVVYPIIRLQDHGLSVGAYVHALESAVIAALADWNIPAHADPKAIGVWVAAPRCGAGFQPAPASPDTPGPSRSPSPGTPGQASGKSDCPRAGRDGGGPAKVCAIGVRIRRGVSMHGLALNISTNLDHFDLIIPCGLQGRQVTSLTCLLGPATPPMDAVKQTLLDHLRATLRSQEKKLR